MLDTRSDPLNVSILACQKEIQGLRDAKAREGVPTRSLMN
jgi:hypothetical protein